MPTFTQITSPPQAQAEVIVNQALVALEHQAVYGQRHEAHNLLTWAYHGGRWSGFSVAQGTLTLTDAATNYVVVTRASGAISVSTSSTNWDNATDYARVYKITTTGGAVSAVEDHRAGEGGVHGGGGSTSSSPIPGLEYMASSTTTDSDPGTGVIRWNNSTHASATILYLDNADADGSSLASLWALLGTNTLLRINVADDPDVWQLWRLTASPTDGTGYYKFPVALVAQEGGTIADTELVRIEMAPVMKSSNLQVLGFACSDLTTALTTGTAVGACINPFSTAFVVTDVVASLKTAQSSGSTFTVDVNEAGSTILSTKLTIDNGEQTSRTAATPRVISDASIASGAEITADIDQVGDGTATGLTVYVIGYPS